MFQAFQSTNGQSNHFQSSQPQNALFQANGSHSHAMPSNTTDSIQKAPLDGETFYELINPPAVPRVVRPVKKMTRKLVKNKEGEQGYNLEKDNRVGFRITKERAIIPEVSDDEENVMQEEVNEQVMEVFRQDPRLTAGVNVIDWEDRIIWETDKVKPLPKKKADKHVDFVKGDVFVPIDTMNMEVDDWEATIYQDVSRKRSALEGIQMGSAEKILAANRASQALILSAPRRKRRRQPGQADQVGPLNISRDDYYEWHPKSIPSTARQAAGGTLELQHSKPAYQLYPPHYRAYLTLKQLRSYHRPPLRTPMGICRFMRTKDFSTEGKTSLDEIIRGAKDITLADTSDYVLFEYSEEYPAVLSNPGMATMMKNYYRRVDENDETVVVDEFGGSVPLEPDDPTPFPGFANIPKGKSSKVISNNLYQAPVFPQPTGPYDFLLIKHNHKGISKYYVRPLQNLFVVGQTLPTTDVPAPQSRKIVTTLRHKMQVYAYRTMAMHHNIITKGGMVADGRYDGHSSEAIHPASVSMKYLMREFPDFNRDQIRQKFKEFRVFMSVRSYWRLKPQIPFPSEEHIRQMVTPESICLYHSMKVGLQKLEDIGFRINEIEDAVKEGVPDESDPTDAGELELQLAPWLTTRNYLMSTQSKALLQIGGVGDPTGCGEGFSFLRAPMKEMFEDGKTVKFNYQEQQNNYRKVIQRVWDRQAESLSRQTPIHVQPEPEKDSLNVPRAASPMSPGATSPAGSPAYSDNEQVGGEEIGIHRSHHLVITRSIRNKMGQVEIKKEVVEDYRVAKKYLLEKKRREEGGVPLASTALTGGKKREAPGTPAAKKAAKKSNNLKCTACGQVGHIRTNKDCPEYYTKGPGAAKMSGAGTPSAASPHAMSPTGAMSTTSPRMSPSRPTSPLSQPPVTSPPLSPIVKE